MTTTCTLMRLQVSLLLLSLTIFSSIDYPLNKISRLETNREIERNFQHHRVATNSMKFNVVGEKQLTRIK